MIKELPDFSKGVFGGPLCHSQEILFQSSYQQTGALARHTSFCHVVYRLRLHVAIHRPDSFVSMLHYCTNLKVIGYESTNLDRIVADKWHSVIVA